MIVHKVLRLYITGEKFYVQPLGQESADGRVLEIDRVTQEIQLLENHGQIPPKSAEVKEIYGIVGILHLIAGPYLVVITKRKLVGLFFDDEIWQMKDVEVIPFPKTTMHLTESQISDNKILLQMAKNTFNTDGFYLSYSYDITHSVQRLYNTSSDFAQLPLYERADQRFVWNHQMLRLFSVQPELSSYTLPLMHGFVSIKKASIKSFIFDFILISRRSCYRAGTRYNIRGLDDHGEVANFCETEQVIIFNGEVASYVQTRGSIPLYWSQYPTIKYKPKPKLTPNKNHSDGFRKHVNSQLMFYGKQILVNLIDTKGGEKILGDKFESECKASSYTDVHLKYVAFDFHKECSKMRWDRLSLLMDELKSSLDDMAHFRMNRAREALLEQGGVVRTNCMDCLDRTNVVQSLIARYILEKQLQDFKVITEGGHIKEYDTFENIFRNVWADNADMMAHQYTGTGALKTDFTRTGKRSKFGLLQDGYNSMVRYYKNNFSDGYRQDGIDLILGNYDIDTSKDKSKVIFEKNTSWLMTLPVILLVGFSMFTISLLIPSTDFRFQMMYVLFWAFACLVTLYFVVLYGTEIVDKPRLANKRDNEVKT